MDVPEFAQLPGTVALAVAATVFVAALLTRRVWLALLGPVFAYESTRLARRGRLFAMRALYGIALLAILFAIVPSRLSVGEDELNRVAAEFGRAFMLAQAAVVMLLTPLYVAGAFGDEKESGSLDFLLSTQLGEREIVLGKFGARLLNLLGLIFAGLPILALTQLWGGVEILRVIAGFAAIAVTAISLGSFCIACSVIARTSVRATLVAYGVSAAIFLIAHCLPFGYVVSPIAFELHPDLSATVPERLATFAAVHGVFAVGCLSLAVVQLRLSAGPPEPVRHPLLELVPHTLQPEYEAARAIVLAKQGPTGLEPETPFRERVALPPVPDNCPLLWKEAFVGRSVDAMILLDMTWLCYAVIVSVAGVLSLTSLAYERSSLDSTDSTSVFFAFVIPPALAFMFTIGYRLSGSITRERERRTLESLLVLPGNRTEILTAKWRGAFRRSYRILFVLGLTFLAGTLGGALHPLSAGLLALVIAIQTVFVATLALFLSSVCRSTVQANVILVVVLLVIFVGTWLVSFF